METLEVEGFLPVYKGVPPFEKLKDGFGYLGVLLEDKETGKLQCHICGNLVNNISKHLYHNHKEVTPTGYKEMFGLNKYTPLVSERTRKLIKNNFLNLTEEKRKQLIERLRNNNKKVHGEGKWKKRELKRSPQYENKYGTCPEQARTRFYKEYEKLGRIPNNSELSGGLNSELSGGLRSLIYTRFSSYKEALLAWGISENEYREHVVNGKLKAIEVRKSNNYFPKYNSEEVKKLYSDFFFEKKRMPTWGEVRQYGMPSRDVFERAFGGTKSQVENNLAKNNSEYGR